jgi:hypothetical protein
MGSEATKLLEAALKRPPEVHAAMGGSLLDSVDTSVDANSETEWEQKIDRSLKVLDSSHADLVSDWCWWYL